ncbi:MAG: hypothetical protein HC827_24140 [Cyanobacteria bacterium RM1_2_2]|nr:hypothetical protein [Cyanobacteria bacterium RM1_2_2]
MNSVPYSLIADIADQFNAVDCVWRESERSFTGFVAEVWFDELPSEFAIKWAEVVGYAVKVRRVDRGVARFAVSVPCVV